MVQKLSAEQLEYRARLFRATYGFDEDQTLDVHLLLERYLAKHTELNFRVVEDWELPQAEAQTYALGNSIKVSRSLKEGFDRNDPRAQLIILEELSHYLFQHSGIRNRSKDDRDSTVLPRSIHATEEWQAKYFAIALKSPIDQAVKCSSASEIQIKFGLSAQAAKIRWEEAQREVRKISRKPRPIPPDIAVALDSKSNNLDFGTNVRRSNPRPKDYEKSAVAFSAVAQGYSNRMCPNCKNYTVIVAGGCWTCGTCGDSNCD
jgi:hypothetical protein